MIEPKALHNWYLFNGAICYVVAIGEVIFGGQGEIGILLIVGTAFATVGLVGKLALED